MYEHTHSRSGSNFSHLDWTATANVYLDVGVAQHASFFVS